MSTRPNSYYRDRTPALAAEIRRAYFAREGTQHQLAARFGVPRGTIAGIIAGRVWVDAKSA